MSLTVRRLRRLIIRTRIGADSRGFKSARVRSIGVLRARAEINSHFVAGPQARWRGASDEQYPARYVRSEPQSERAVPLRGRGARPELARDPRRCPTSPSSRRLASARPALAPKCPYYFLTDLKPELQTPFSVALWLNRRAVINNDFFLQTGLEYIMERSSTPIRVDPGGTQ